MASEASGTNSVSEASQSDDAGSISYVDNDNAKILSAEYLQRSKGKKDLIRYLRQIVEILRDDENVEPDSAEFPGLNNLCQELSRYMDHRDKQVRLYAVNACMELFTIYAPDAPWNTDETLDIFRQTIRQLASLAHTTAPTQPHYGDYARILELLAEVKIGVILVEMTKEEDCQAEALPVLAELFRTLLQSVRADHPPEIAERAQATICGCLEEFHDGITLPTPLLDEILICVGQGPRVLVINPQKAAAQPSRKNLPAHQVEQTNPSYLVASSVIRGSVDRLSTPIAALLNGLLNNDVRLVSESSISTQLVKELSKPQTQDQNFQADVYNIIYELHRVAPSVLTTVVGTLTNFLSVPEVDQRKLVIQLLGKLFVKATAKFANQFRLCFRQWLERAQDKDQSIRILMVHHLLLLILPVATNTVVENELDQVSEEAQAMLRLCLEDPASDVRLKTIHGICDVAYRHPEAVSLDTWLAVGVKVTSKQKQERKDALTGLVQTYFHHFIAKRLKDVQTGGDNVALEVVRETMEAGSDHDKARFEWIPSRVFECASLKDDADLHSRVWQAMDDMLLGSELASSSKRLSSTARAVGLALVVENLEENAMSWLGAMLRERAKLQQKLNEYINARTSIRDYPVGSEEFMSANANALDLLEAAASFTDLQIGSTGERSPVLEKFHSAKDKHIFRILSTIATPTHSTKARIRAVDELPKRVKSQGDGAVKFVKGIVRKCAMGDFLNQEIVHHCILLAQECGVQSDWESCRKFLRCIELTSNYFPAVCGDVQCFQNLTELFGECRSSKEKSIGDVVTTVSAILAKAAPTHKGEGAATSVNSNFRKDLLQLCRDGTPDQARHAVRTLTATTAEDEEGQFSNTLSNLLYKLSGSSVLSKTCKAVVTVLASLSVFSEEAPHIMASPRGLRAVQFALDTVLLGHDKSSNMDAASSDEESNIGQARQSRKQSKSMTPQRRKSGKRKHLSPGISSDILDDADLSFTCRTLCAAIEFLVAFIRSSIFSSRKLPQSQDASENRSLYGFSPENIEKLFDSLCTILQNGGIPPAKQDRKECDLRQDRAALRQCAAVNLLRLCDPRLALDQRFLTTRRWHTLAGAFLDDEHAVRDRVLEELGLMLTGNGRYGNHAKAGQAMIPRFSFLALVVLCTDGDHGSANGHAAPVGKRSTTTKMNVLECVNALRRKFEVESEQARANGPEAEEQFERQMKVRLMPEYVVPYAFHLLAFREETPKGINKARKRSEEESDLDEDCFEYRENQEKALRKRLKWLLDPLILSLGETADNISFLMRMADKLAQFAPVLDPSTTIVDSKATARLSVVCEDARNVLMSYVKKDVNLAYFPGQILLPGNLFRKPRAKTSNIGSPAKATSTTGNRSRQSSPGNRNKPQSDTERARQGPSDSSDGTGGIHASVAQRKNQTGSMSETKRTRQNARSPVRTKSDQGRVHFSPEVATREIPGSSSFEALSPIERRTSVADGSHGALLDSGEKTRGTTPPSAVKDMALLTSNTSLQPTSSQPITDSPSSRSSRRRVRRRKDDTASRRQSHLEKSGVPQPNTQSTENVFESKREMSPSPELAQNAKKKSRQTPVPLQIEIVRNRPSQDVPPKESKRVTRNRAKRAADDLDFENDTNDTGGPRKPASKGKPLAYKNKENNEQPRTRPSRRRAKI